VGTMSMNDQVCGITDNSEVLRRQVHPDQFKDGKPTSVAFYPSEKDEHRLSTHRGTVPAIECYRRWTVDLERKSVGTYGISVEECLKQELEPVDDSAMVAPDHASVVFPDDWSRGTLTRRGRILRDAALNRGVLHQPPAP